MMAVGEKGRYEVVGDAVEVKDVGAEGFGAERLALMPSARTLCLSPFHGRTKDGVGIGTKFSAGAVVAHLLSEDGAIDCALVPTYLEVELA